MLEIINEFFFKESRIRNITIDELLKEYEIEEKLFWNYVYDFSLMTAEKIKKENQRREGNKNALEIYRLTKDGTLTFGDIARMKNKSIEQVIEALQNEYLNGIKGYSFDAIQQQNIELLKQRKEFQIYFYFIEHEVTFEQLGKQFGLEESQVIYLFDSILDSELTRKEIKRGFALNKNRKYQQNKKKLCDLFILTEEEVQSNETEKTSILVKISICNLIEERKIYRCPEEKFCVIEYYMRLYAYLLNSPKLTYQDIRKQYKTNIGNGKVIDQKLNTDIFSEISDMIKKTRMRTTDLEKYNQLYKYYMDNFILFRDLAPLFGIEQIEVQKYYQQEEKQNEWLSICEIEKQRQTIIMSNVSILFQTSQLLSQLLCYTNSKDELKKYKLEDQLKALIKEKIMFSDLCRQNSYIEKLIRSMQFTGLYLFQENFDTKKLVQLFNIKSTNTIVGYLYHPLTTKLLDREAQQYIEKKRRIAEQYNRKQNFQKLTINEKGQFTKKYQTPENTESDN